MFHNQRTELSTLEKPQAFNNKQTNMMEDSSRIVGMTIILDAVVDVTHMFPIGYTLWGPPCGSDRKLFAA